MANEMTREQIIKKLIEKEGGIGFVRDDMDVYGFYFQDDVVAGKLEYDNVMGYIVDYCFQDDGCAFGTGKTLQHAANGYTDRTAWSEFSTKELERFLAL